MSREVPMAEKAETSSGRSNADMAFRKLQNEDLPLMHRWLNDPAVVEWWEGDDVSWPAVVSQYGSNHSSPVEHWIALSEGNPLGWIQCYCATEVAEEEAFHWKQYLELRETAGIDYLIGEATQRGGGTGSAMIRAFARDVVFARHPEWAFAAAAPFEANVASWRALEKAGFRRVAVLDDEDGPCVLMVANRDEFRG